MIQPNYLINKRFSYMWGFYDRQGNPCTVVIERGRNFVVGQSPLNILDDTIREVGFTLKGAREDVMEAAKDEHPDNIHVSDYGQSHFKNSRFPYRIT